MTIRPRFLLLLLALAAPAFAGRSSRFTTPTPPAPPRAPPPPHVDDDEEDDDSMRARPLATRDDDDEDDDEEDEDHDRQKRDRDERDRSVRIYRMDREQMRKDRDQMREDMRRMRHDRGDEDEDEDREQDASAKARGRGHAELQLRGPVMLQVRAQGGDIEVTGSDRGTVAATVSDTPSDEVAIFQYGDRIELGFRGRRELRRGKVRVELPRGSRVDVSSMSGDVAVQRVSGEVRIRTMSGDVKLAGVAKVDVQTISGDVTADDVAGPVRLHTVSGHAIVHSANKTPQLEYQSASGVLEWSGTCARDCHLAAETVSGDVKLALDPSSSFELSYTSHSGEMRDGLNLAIKRAPKKKFGMSGGWLEATYGKGEGSIECDSFSGTVALSRR